MWNGSRKKWCCWREGDEKEGCWWRRDGKNSDKVEALTECQLHLDSEPEGTRSGVVRSAVRAAEKRGSVQNRKKIFKYMSKYADWNHDKLGIDKLLFKVNTVPNARRSCGQFQRRSLHVLPSYVCMGSLHTVSDLFCPLCLDDFLKIIHLHYWVLDVLVNKTETGSLFPLIWCLD